jgi:hypothetical protein
VSWTTEDLRELMTDRCAEPPPAPDRVAGAKARARRQQWSTVGGGTAVVVAVGALIVGTAWLDGTTQTPAPRPEPVVTAPTPSLPAPFDTGRLIHTVRFHGLRITTNGPATIPPATQPVTSTFAVVVTAQNQSLHSWSGRLSVGVVGRSAAANGPFGWHPVTNSLFADDVPGAGHHTISRSAILPGRRIFQGAGPRATCHIGPGASISFVLQLGYASNQVPNVRVAGWLPALETGDQHFAMPDPHDYRDVSWG